MQNSFQDNCLSKTTVFDKYEEFNDGRESVVEDPWSGRPSTFINDRDIDMVRELVLGDRCMTIRNILMSTTNSYVIWFLPSNFKGHLGLRHVAWS